MAVMLAVPTAQICVFALGCALIHAGRAHAELVTRVLVAALVVAGALVLLGASLANAPGDPDALDAVSVYDAASATPAGTAPDSDPRRGSAGTGIS